MTREQYQKITEPFRDNAGRTKCVAVMNHVLTAVVFFGYPFYLVTLLFAHNMQIVRAVCVPAVSFVLLTVIRKRINAPRPYEKFGIPPVIEKNTEGKSFPSRHVFSVFIIAVTIFQTYHAAGIVFGIIGAVLGVIRVLVGVHEPKDVLVGALAGIFCGVLGYYVL